MAFYFSNLILQTALYKSGKQWITAAIATIAVSTGIILGGGGTS